MLKILLRATCSSSSSRMHWRWKVVSACIWVFHRIKVWLPEIAVQLFWSGSLMSCVLLSSELEASHATDLQTQSCGVGRSALHPSSIIKCHDVPWLCPSCRWVRHNLVWEKHAFEHFAYETQQTSNMSALLPILYCFSGWRLALVLPGPLPTVLVLFGLVEIVLPNTTQRSMGGLLVEHPRHVTLAPMSPRSTFLHLLAE